MAQMVESFAVNMRSPIKMTLEKITVTTLDLVSQIVWTFFFCDFGLRLRWVVSIMIS
jgi:hypothetical protein